ncbi:MAG: aldehyde dehydrogenase family protein [Myxococcota bacterium]
MTRSLSTRDNGSFPKTLLVSNLIDGEEREAEGQKRFEARSACDHRDVVGTAPLSTRGDVERACQAAGRAAPGWAAVPAPVRGEMIGRLGAAISAHKETLAKVVCREIGKTMREARGEVQEAIDTAHFFMGEGRRLYGQTVPSEMPRKELFTYRRPLGVAALITAGNFPMAVPSWKIIPALLTGNTVVWKPSEDAPVIAYLFGRLIQEAGVPRGVVNIIHGTGGGGAGEAILEMVDKGLIQKVSFTGSTEVGRKIGEVCGRNLQIPSLELGGKNPLVVLKDADIDLAVEGALFAGFGTAGQRCTSLGNLIVDRSVEAEVKKRLLARLAEIKIGNPAAGDGMLYGPLIAERFYKRFMEHYAMGRESGAKLLTQEGRITSANKPAGFVGDPEHGYYVFPAVWDNVKIESKLAQTEVFGPTINIISVDGFEEAIRAANGTPYGLSSACYTNDARSILRFKTEIKAGMTSINNSTSGAEAHLPFGGCGWSGNGTRESGVWVLDAYTRWHAVNEDMAGKLQLAQIDVDFGKPEEPTDLSALA